MYTFIASSSETEFWNQFHKWYTFEPQTCFSITKILYAIIRNNSMEITLNHIILTVKYHTYCNAISNAHLVFAAFLERFKNTPSFFPFRSRVQYGGQFDSTYSFKKRKQPLRWLPFSSGSKIQFNLRYTAYIFLRSGARSGVVCTTSAMHCWIIF